MVENKILRLFWLSTRGKTKFSKLPLSRANFWKIWTPSDQVWGNLLLLFILALVMKDKNWVSKLKKSLPGIKLNPKLTYCSEFLFLIIFLAQFCIEKSEF